MVYWKSEKWTINTYDVPGRKIVNTEAVGTANREGVQKLLEYVEKKGKSFGGKWAYVPIIDKIEPIIDPDAQQEFAKIHTVCEEAGCVAIAFVAGGLASIKVQAKRHQQASHAEKLTIEYFRTMEEALDWVKTLGV